MELITRIEELSTSMYPRVLRVLTFAGVLAACGQGPVTHYEPAPLPKPEPPDAGLVWTPTPKVVPLVVPQIEAKKASWLERPDPAATVHDKLAPRKAHSLGTNAAVVRAGDQLVVLTRDRGVISIFEAKGATVRLMTGDAALISMNGSLHRAPDPAAIPRLGKNPKLARAPSPVTLWDAAGRFVAIASGRAVHVSTNGGERFRRTRLPGRGAGVSAILVRPDGVMVAVVSSKPKRRTTYVSRGGAGWRRASFQPQRPLVRYGSWIHDDDDDCTAVLAKDGRRWFSAKLGDAFERLPPWRSRTALAATPSGRLPKTRHPSANRPPPPSQGEHVLRGNRKKCDVLLGGVLGGVMGGLGAFGRASSSLSSLRATRWPHPVQTPTSLAFLEDGVCLTRNNACDFSSPKARLPGMVRFSRLPDAKKVELLGVPSGCKIPQRVYEVQGLGVLACGDGDSTQLFGISGTPAKVVDEGQIAAKANALAGFAIASDGTLGLVHECSEGTCRAWIRRGGRWRELTVPKAVAYRFLPGGRALILVAESETETTAKVGLALFDGAKTRTLVRGIELDEPTHSFELDDKGHVLFAFKNKDKTVPKMVGIRGELIDAR